MIFKGTRLKSRQWIVSFTRCFLSIYSLLLLGHISVPNLTYGANFSHIKAFGFDFDYAGVQNGSTLLSWLATHHDYIIGLQPGGFITIAGEKLPESYYDALKAANAGVKIYAYWSGAQQFSAQRTWQESWASSNSLNPEDLYYHYYFDTIVQTTTGPLTVKGYGGGTASSLAEARIPTWWSGGENPLINPTSMTFVEAFQNMLLEVVTVNSNNGKYLDGLELDSCETLVLYAGGPLPYPRYLENTIEMRNLGYTTSSTALQKAREDLGMMRGTIETFLRQKTGKTDFTVFCNGADIENIYRWYPELYNNDTWFPIKGVEYLVTSTKLTMEQIPYLQKAYEDMAIDGVTMFLQGQTNFTRDQRIIPFGFKQFIIAMQYLINHLNAIFAFHEGSAGCYCGLRSDGTVGPGGDLSQTLWHVNYEYNIGIPVVRVGPDYWGANNTDRFYVFAQGSNYKILAREYTNALVLAKFGDKNGFDNIGLNPTTHDLGGEYMRLQLDKNLGPLISQITLGGGEGAILIKIPVSIGISPAAANMSVGQNQQVTAIALDGLANTMVGIPLTWNSSAPAVATVDADGLVTAAAPGTATITASVGGVTSNQANLTVTAASTEGGGGGGGCGTIKSARKGQQSKGQIAMSLAVLFAPIAFLIIRKLWKVKTLHQVVPCRYERRQRQVRIDFPDRRGFNRRIVQIPMTFPDRRKAT